VPAAGRPVPAGGRPGHLLGDALAVAGGGLLGTAARAAIGLVLPAEPIAWAVVAVDVAGALVLGLLVAQPLGRRGLLGWGTGVLGAFTTFGALAAQAVDLGPVGGMGYAACLTGAGVAAAALGGRLAGWARAGLAAVVLAGVAALAVAVTQRAAAPAELAAVAAAGGVGTLVRWGLGVLDGRWPVGTAVANLGGSAALGVVLAAPLPARTTAVLAVGLLGGLTTFSTLAVQAVALGRRDGAAYAAASTVAGVALVALGGAVGGRL
jgi:CrcB protein